ncbi:MAG: hypothetical protein RIT26_1319 [Pseudomonadota bacterium]|jgi:glycosyltransferase involved in cell wall biosynthesis
MSEPKHCSSAPKYSLVIATLDRVEGFTALLASICAEKDLDLEIIVVDQNSDDRLADALNGLNADIPLTHLRVHFKGVSKARNFGAQHARGQFLFFPDDDAEILPGYFKLADHCIDQGHRVIFGKCVDRNGADSLRTFSPKPAPLTLRQHRGMFVEPNMLIQREVFLQTQFDESLGVGVFHGAEEGFDLVLRLLKKNVPIYYTPELKVYHPNKILDQQSEEEIRRIFAHRCGYAKVCRKHRLYFRLLKRITLVSACLLLMAVINRRRVRFYFSELLGLFTGLVIR